MKTLVIGRISGKFPYGFDIEQNADIVNSSYLVSYDCVIFSLEDYFDDYYYKDFGDLFSKKKGQIEEFLNKGKKLIIVNPSKKHNKSAQLSNGKKRDMTEFLDYIFPFEYRIEHVKGSILVPERTLEFSSNVIKYATDASYEIMNYHFSYANIKDANKSVIASCLKDNFVLSLPMFRFTDLSDFLKLISSINNLPYSQLENLVIPEWIKNFHVLNEEEIIEDIEKNRTQVEKIEENIIKLNEDLQNIEYIKSILFTQDTHLENVVEHILKEIGINVEKNELENRVDRIIYIDSSEKAVVEIKGRLKKSAKESDCTQLEKWKMEEMEKLGYEPKGILVMNAFAEIELSQRQEYFPSQILSFAEKKELSLVSSECLLKMYIDFKHGNITKEAIYNILITNIGILDYKPLYQK